LGVSVPEKFSVVGFDDVPQAGISQPPLTTIHSFRDNLAQIAVERLLARIEGDDSPPQYINLGTELIVRASTGHAPES
jgi:LacI family transcriptional regulator